VEKTAKDTVIVLGAVAAVVLASSLVWVTTANAARNAVSIGFDDVPVECASGNTYPYELDSGRLIPGIELTADLDCAMHFHATNNSLFPVEITRINLPFAGPTTGGGPHVVSLEGEFATVTPVVANSAVDTTVDAVLEFESPVVLDPDESVAFSARLALSPDVCSSEGSIFYTAIGPTATITAIGNTAESSTNGGGYAFIGTRYTSCDG